MSAASWDERNPSCVRAAAPSAPTDASPVLDLFGDPELGGGRGRREEDRRRERRAEENYDPGNHSSLPTEKKNSRFATPDYPQPYVRFGRFAGVRC
eukprot:CAMPEP_0113590180 /NCGR_PEP_ID=MMETSP0015_2-20120614/36524_1 /TAXON_ID=2838 /ORGANISM="Odontella" /LENGTH=95 /DNA_ID=CAMNT_0000496329 /DNA_START=709 /DNA_END=996 /DNA_ORIENTATION=- /assembly_acc=CAM_ASM_000160